MRLLVCIAGLIFAQLAAASPWLRPEGSQLLTFSIEISDTDGEFFGAAYYELGYRDRMTLGFDFGTTDRDLDKAILFAKFPVRQSVKNFNTSAQIGIGLADQDAVLRPGFSIGRGLVLNDKSGWISVDTLAPISVSDGSFQLKTDVTIGLDLSDRSLLLLQLQTGYELGNVEYVKLAPSFVLSLPSGQRLELGVLTGLEGSTDFALKLGLWNEF